MAKFQHIFSLRMGLSFTRFGTYHGSWSDYACQTRNMPQNHSTILKLNRKTQTGFFASYSLLNVLLCIQSCGLHPVIPYSRCVPIVGKTSGTKLSFVINKAPQWRPQLLLVKFIVLLAIFAAVCLSQYLVNGTWLHAQIPDVLPFSFISSHRSSLPLQQYQQFVATMILFVFSSATNYKVS